MSFLVDLFCKKRKNPQSSHSSSPLPKETSRTKTSTSTKKNDQRISEPEQGESNDRLKESTQTQLISDSEEEVSRSETNQPQKSGNRNSGVSATTASSTKTKEQDIQIKGEKHEKITKIKPKTDNFMEGEGLQAIVKKRKNNEDAQKENNKEKTHEKAEQQKHKDNNVIEAKDVQGLDEGQFSDELSHQSSSGDSDSLADFEEISQVETEYVSIEEKRSLGSPEKRVTTVKKTEKVKRTKAEALEELKNFPLKELKMTKENYFDMRKKLAKEYLNLCEEAGEDAKSYYYNEMYKSEKQVIAEEKKENGLEKASNEENKMKEEALKELKKFPLNELKMTKDKLFDKRLKQTKAYLDLCEKAQKDPEQYYKENFKEDEKIKGNL